MTALASSVAARHEVSLLGSARQISPREWDALARRGFHLHGWCTAAERCGWNARHVAVRGPRGLHAVIPAYCTGQGTLHDLHDRWLGRLGRLASRAGVDLRPVISVQAPLGAASEPIGDLSPLSENQVHEIFRLLESAAEEDGAKAIVWPFIDVRCRRVLEVGRQRGYTVHYSGASARLPIAWTSFEQYVQTRSKSVRRTIRSDLAALRAAGVESSFVSDFRRHAALMDWEYRRAFRARNGCEAPIPQDFFSRLAQEPCPAIRAHLTWTNERLVGMSLNLITRGLMDGTLAAFAPECRGGPVYYNDLCYEPIRLAIREAVSAIELGATALYAKVLRGAVLRRRMVLIRGTTAARRGLLSMLGHVAAQRTEYKERRALGSLWGKRCFKEEEEGT